MAETDDFKLAAPAGGFGFMPPDPTPVPAPRPSAAAPAARGVYTRLSWYQKRNPGEAQAWPEPTVAVTAEPARKFEKPQPWGQGVPAVTELPPPTPPIEPTNAFNSLSETTISSTDVSAVSTAWSHVAQQLEAEPAAAPLSTPAAEMPVDEMINHQGLDWATTAKSLNAPLPGSMDRPRSKTSSSQFDRISVPGGFLANVPEPQAAPTAPAQSSEPIDPWAIVVSLPQATGEMARPDFSAPMPQAAETFSAFNEPPMMAAAESQPVSLAEAPPAAGIGWLSPGQVQEQPVEAVSAENKNAYMTLTADGRPHPFSLASVLLEGDQSPPPVVLQDAPVLPTLMHDPVVISEPTFAPDTVPPETTASPLPKLKQFGGGAAPKAKSIDRKPGVRPTAAMKPSPSKTADMSLAPAKKTGEVPKPVVPTKATATPGSVPVEAVAQDFVDPRSGGTEIDRDTVEVPHLRLPTPDELKTFRPRPAVNLHMPGENYSTSSDAIKKPYISTGDEAADSNAAEPFDDTKTAIEMSSVAFASLAPPTPQEAPPPPPPPAIATPAPPPVSPTSAAPPVPAAPKPPAPTGIAAIAAAVAAASARLPSKTGQMAQPTLPQTPTAPVDANTYVVRAGDTIESLAANNLRDPSLAALLFNLNRKYILPEEEYGVHPLIVGATIQLPTIAEVAKFKSGTRR